MSERPASPYEWASRIKAELRKSVDGVLTVGQLFLEAKAALNHGEFERMFIDLPIDLRMAEMYMSIASNPALTNPKHVSILPPAMSTLYVLSRVESLQLEAAIADGLIHPRLQRAEAKALFVAPAPPLARWSLADCEEHLRQLINHEITRAPAEDRDQITGLLRQLADELEQARDPERQDDAQAALDNLEIHDSEPGGYRLFFDNGTVDGIKSTHAAFYKSLTKTQDDDVTPLKRQQVEARLNDIRVGCLPTRRTARTYHAVAWQIRGEARRSQMHGGIDQ